MPRLPATPLLAAVLAGCVLDYNVRKESDRGAGALDTAPPPDGTDTGLTGGDGGGSGEDGGQTGPTDTGPAPDTGAPDTGPTPDTGTPDTGTPDTGTPDTPEPAVACAPGAAGVPVGCAMDVGPGRLFVWGDEHVTFDEYRPDADLFWTGALTWLADPSGAGRLTVDDRRGSAAVASAAAGLGLVVTGPGADIVLVDLFSGVTGAQIAGWLAAGKAVMVMAIGYGSSECSAMTAITAGLPLTYDCVAEPWGPVGSFTAHPIGAGLAAVNAPFVNGRAVVEVGGPAAEAVAFIP